MMNSISYIGLRDCMKSIEVKENSNIKMVLVMNLPLSPGKLIILSSDHRGIKNIEDKTTTIINA